VEGIRLPAGGEGRMFNGGGNEGHGGRVTAADL
jgi:hypothetical protein